MNQRRTDAATGASRSYITMKSSLINTLIADLHSKNQTFLNWIDLIWFCFGFCHPLETNSMLSSIDLDSIDVELIWYRVAIYVSIPKSFVDEIHASLCNAVVIIIRYLLLLIDVIHL